MKQELSSLTAPIELVQELRPLSSEVLEAKLSDAQFQGNLEARTAIADWLRREVKALGHPPVFNPVNWVLSLADQIESFGDVPQEND